MFHGVSYFSGVDVVGVDKVDYLSYVYRRLVGRSFYDVWLVLKVVVCFGIDERDASCGVFSVFECFDVGDATSVATETSYGKDALVENLVELVAKKFSVVDDVLPDVVFLCCLFHGEIAVARCPTVVFPTDNMEKDFTGVGILLVVFSHPGDKSVESVPIVNFCYSN